jgi:hypothetical protein
MERRTFLLVTASAAVAATQAAAPTPGIEAWLLHSVNSPVPLG